MMQSRLRPDERYNEFFGKVLDTKRKGAIPQQLRFLSWNYDILPEKSFFAFVDDIIRVRQEILESNSFIRLNGIAGVVNPTPRNIVPNYHTAGYVEAATQSEEQMDVMQLLDLFNQLMRFPMGELKPAIKFAWESDSVENRIQDSIAGTEILVVIGYSFPDFNAEIDMQILRTLLNTTKHVVLQAPNSPLGNLDSLVERLALRCEGRLPKDKITPFDSGTWFYRPSELPIG